MSFWLQITFPAVVWPDHPLGRSVAGLSDTVSRLTREDVIYFTHRTYMPDRIIVIRVSEDGGGIDLEAIRTAALTRGFLTPEAAAIAAPDELTDLLFQTGFSTAGQVSEVSGRGVGLDIVRVMVERLKWTVSLASTPGQGTTFTVRLPLTMAVIRALMVVAEGQTFALPLGSITQILRLEPEQCGKIGNQDVVRLGGETLPVFALAKRLGLRGATEPATRSPAVVLNVADRRYVVVIDRIAGGREVVVKSLGTHVRHAPGIAGAPLMGDGYVVLILDPMELCTPARASRPASVTTRAMTARITVPEQLLVMVVDDSPSVFAGWNGPSEWFPLPSSGRTGVLAAPCSVNRTEPPDGDLAPQSHPGRTLVGDWVTGGCCCGTRRTRGDRACARNRRLRGGRPVVARSRHRRDRLVRLAWVTCNRRGAVAGRGGRRGWLCETDRLADPRRVRMLKLPIPNLSSERVFPGTAERTVVPVEVGEETIGLIDLTSLTQGTQSAS